MPSDITIVVVPCFWRPHFTPHTELCKLFSERNYRVTLLIPSNRTTTVQPSLHRYPLIEIAGIPDVPPQQMDRAIESFLCARINSPTRPAFAVIDEMMSMDRAKGLFSNFNIPMVTLIDSAACSAVMKLKYLSGPGPDVTEPNDAVPYSLFPEDVALTDSERERLLLRPVADFSPPDGLGGPVGQFRWLNSVTGSKALLFNIRADLELPFIGYLSYHVGIPARSVGPLLPKYVFDMDIEPVLDNDYNPGSAARPRSRSVIEQEDVIQWMDSKPGGFVRPAARPKSRSVIEEDLIQWMDSKPRGSVLYVSFGTEVGPTPDELAQLGEALAESNRPFIWAFPPGSGTRRLARDGDEAGSDAAEEGYDPRCLDEDKLGGRGFILGGRVPQTVILNHPSTGGFLSQCGWNSTLEAIELGIPILAWPVSVGQFCNAKLVVNYHKVGHMVPSSTLEMVVNKDDILEGIENLMTDQEVRTRAAALSENCKGSFPKSSEDTLDFLTALFETS